MLKFDEQDELDGCIDLGGDGKSATLGAAQYPSERFQPRKPTPLLELIKTLSLPFQSRYHAFAVETEHLHSSLWFIEAIKLALEVGEWPADVMVTL